MTGGGAIYQAHLVPLDMTGIITPTTASSYASAKPLLRAAMKNGRRVAAKEPLTKTRERVCAELAQLPARLHRLERSDPYRVEIAESIHRLARVADEAVSR